MADGLPGEAAHVSLYVRLAASLRSRIDKAEWKPGGQMPTVERLAEEYGVGRVTVRQAIALLVADGLVTSSRGRGTFVAPPRSAGTGQAAMRKAINERLELAEGETVEVLATETLSVVPDRFQPDGPLDPVYVRMLKLHLLFGSPFALVDSVLTQRVARRLPPDGALRYKLLKLLSDDPLVRIKSSRQEITVTHADQAAAAALRCAVTAPLVKIRSWRRDEAGVLLFGTVTLYRGDRFVYDIVEEDTNLQHTPTLVIPSRR